MICVREIFMKKTMLILALVLAMAAPSLHAQNATQLTQRIRNEQAANPYNPSNPNFNPDNPNLQGGPMGGRGFSGGRGPGGGRQGGPGMMPMQGGTNAQANGGTNASAATTSAGQRLLKALDTNNDGIIDANEINNATNSLKKLDRRGDGKLTEDEYLFDTEARPSLSPLVRVLDINKDGIIDAEEIKQAPMSLRMLDKNFDGRLTGNEYLLRFETLK